MINDAIIQITGIQCAGCFNRIEQLVWAQRVNRYHLDVATSKLKINYDDEKTSPQILVKSLTNAGYPSKLIDIISTEVSTI